KRFVFVPLGSLRMHSSTAPCAPTSPDVRDMVGRGAVKPVTSSRTPAERARILTKVKGENASWPTLACCVALLFGLQDFGTDPPAAIQPDLQKKHFFSSVSQEVQAPPSGDPQVTPGVWKPPAPSVRSGGSGQTVVPWRARRTS